MSALAAPPSTNTLAARLFGAGKIWIGTCHRIPFAKTSRLERSNTEMQIYAAIRIALDRLTIHLSKFITEKNAGPLRVTRGVSFLNHR